MQHTLSKDLIAISSMLLMAQERGEVIRLAGELNALIESAMKIEKEHNYDFSATTKKTSSTTIKFTKQEVDNMSKTFKKEFISNGCLGRIIQRPSGKNGVYYEIRYRRNGYNVSVCNKDINKAKELFVLATYKLENYKTSVKSKLRFIAIATEWLEYKNGKITSQTLDDYESRISRFVPEELKNKKITDIRTNEIDKAINFASTPRMYEELRSLYNQIFKYAIASGLISHNPVTLIPFKRAERKNRAAMTEEQIKAFLQRIKEPKFDKIRNCAYVLYFFGVRPCELDHEARFENGFFICRNRKRKGGKIEYKKIPIPEQAQEFIDFDKPLTLPFSYNAFLKYMKDALGDGLTPYNTRHTFASTCAEYVKEEIVELWMGDAPERLVGKTYIHYNDNFMKSQMQNVYFII